MNKTDLKKYADLLVRVGVNLQKGQPLVVSAPIEAADLAREIVKSAYKNQASDVLVLWGDDETAKYDYKYRTIESLSKVPSWQKEQREDFIERKAAYIAVASDDPEVFKGCDTKKIAAARRARNVAFAKFRDYTASNKIRWTIAAYPNKKWAKKVFPNDSVGVAYDKLWKSIKATARLDRKNPIAAWAEHQKNLVKRCEILNGANIKSFRYKNSLGTDFIVDMPKDYVFCGGAEEGVLDGVYFTANIPTEEVFSSPDRSSANGRLVASTPLCRNGQIIDGFWFEFKDGKIVDFGAEKGLDNLKSIIETDEGSRYLGEIALVGYNSPVREQNVLFFETLFDENASCHFAIGDCYPNCVKNGGDMTEAQLKSAGLNVSLEHVDFMVGTPDLEIVATTADGKTLVVFKDGDWAF